MFPSVNPTTTESWKRLRALAQENQPPIRDLLEDRRRQAALIFDLEDLYFDFTKNQITSECLSKLIELANECHLSEAIEAMFEGEEINETEGRAVLHTALRGTHQDPQISSLVETELQKVETFSRALHNGTWLGFSGKAITDVVNIGIGGSDLGPKMVTHALRPYWKSIRPHFVSNVDGQQISEVLENLNPESTLFIIASKTFTTQETMTNAATARDWFLSQGGAEQDIANHFVAVSTNQEAVQEFGISASNMFTFWEWVGGRYSLWSSIGLVISCAVGFEHFKALLAGANELDVHFKQEALEKNIPTVAALIGIWYNNFQQYDSVAILPYDHRLRLLPSYLQQADMESNGKTVDRTGTPISYQTGPIIWGEAGTNGQHAFYQLIHQGSKIIPCDFIGVAKGAQEHGGHHQKLLANFLAQPEALLNGKSREQVKEELNQEKEDLVPHKEFSGNRPSTSILMTELSPRNLGKLIAFYEHKIFVQGVIWNVFSFDQWGVELGKQLAKPILSEIQENSAGEHDPSTAELLARIQRARK